MLHRIIVKYTPLVADRRAFEREVEKLFSPLTEMEGIRSVRLIPGLPLAENRYDLMIELDMDEAALPAYNASAPHQTWKKEYAKFVAAKCIFDCEA